MTKGRFLKILVIWLILLFAIVALAPKYIKETVYLGSKNGFGQDAPRLAWSWANLDGNHYLSIARNGYFRFQQGFFPLYPILIRITHDISGLPYVFGGLVVTYLSLAGFLVMFHKLLRLDYSQSSSYWTLLWFLALPASFYLVAVYNDSLFLFLAASAFYLARRGRWWLAGLVGMLASLTRVTGIALFPALVLESMFVLGKRRRGNIAPLMLIPLGMVIYLWYLNIYHGSWKLLMESMAVWGQDKPVFPGQTLFRYAKALGSMKAIGIGTIVGTIDLISVFLSGYLFGAGGKHWRPSYQVFSLVVIFIPLFSGTFLGMPRYFIHAFPLVILLSRIFYHRKTLGVIVMAILIMLELYLLAYFSQGHFIA